MVFSVLRLAVTRLPATWDTPGLLGGVTFAITILVSTGWGLYTERSPRLMRLLFPRDLASWLAWRRAA
jgi:hypothetical protein